MFQPDFVPTYENTLSTCLVEYRLALRKCTFERASPRATINRAAARHVPLTVNLRSTLAHAASDSIACRSASSSVESGCRSAWGDSPQSSKSGRAGSGPKSRPCIGLQYSSEHLSKKRASTVRTCDRGQYLHISHLQPPAAIRDQTTVHRCAPS